MTHPDKQREILLVGSVPLGSAREVFATCSPMLGTRVRRLPDGETGERSKWIGFQYSRLAAAPEFKPLPRPAEQLSPAFGLAADALPLRFGPLGYASAAQASWQEFQALRQSSVIPAGTRFQISLPTPLAVVAGYIRVEDQAAVEPAYTAALDEELARTINPDLERFMAKRMGAKTIEVKQATCR
jgi:hypothetical protein